MQCDLQTTGCATACTLKVLKLYRLTPMQPMLHVKHSGKPILSTLVHQLGEIS